MIICRALRNFVRNPISYHARLHSSRRDADGEIQDTGSSRTRALLKLNKTIINKNGGQTQGRL